MNRENGKRLEGLVDIVAKGRRARLGEREILDAMAASGADPMQAPLLLSVITEGLRAGIEAAASGRAGDSALYAAAVRAGRRSYRRAAFGVFLRWLVVVLAFVAATGAVFLVWVR